MTIDDLCREIAEKTAREGTKWYLNESDAIRARDHLSLAFCPLAFLFSGDYFSQAREQGMTDAAIDRVIAAADGVGAPKTRAKLLRATGLA